MNYNFSEIEEKWRKRWEEWKSFAAHNHSEKPKFYVLDMFPYPSGSGLHVGHPLGYIASDIYARYKRHQGYNVLHPMGYDAFGLPAEQYAIQTGQHPAKTTEQNILRYREQLDKIGFSFDWDREVRTSDPRFYKWTQWIFVQLFHSWYDKTEDRARPISELIEIFTREGNTCINAHCSETPRFTAAEWAGFSEHQKRETLLNYRLAYLAEATVNWCPQLGTVLANDEVVNGVSERGGYPVEQRKMTQWSLRITAYAQRLLDGLETVEWPDSLKEIQRNWIGRSEGAEISFEVAGTNKSIEVFTTRPDTIFGATFMVLAPEHELVKEITAPSQRAEIESYLDYVKGRSERERMAEAKKVTGAFTGAYAINPITETKIPIWIADYVLAGYGTGAIMAVPAGDQRDWDFAKNFQLDIVPVIEGQDVSAGADERKDGLMVNSGFLDGKPVKEAIQMVIEKVEQLGIGRRKVNYKLRDAVFSRQRYWGEPFPVYYKEGLPYTLDEDKLPLVLPEIDQYKPTETGEPPLGRATKWNWGSNGEVVGNGEGFALDLNTMPGWAGSSWYYLRYMDPHNEQEFASREAMDYWGQVDLYMGGAEHATGHLLYFRFWTKFLYDLAYIPFDEPAKKLINQGMIQGKSAIIRTRIESEEKAPDTYEGWHEWVQFINPVPEVFISSDLDLVSDEEFISNYITKEYQKIYKTDLVGHHVKVKKIGHFHINIMHVDEITNEVHTEKLDLKDQSGRPIIFIKNREGKFFCDREIEKMSKSKFNVITPDEVIEHYGADSLRLHEMFLGPIEMHKPWNTKGIDGVHRFLKKLWRLFYDDEGNWRVTDTAPSKLELKALHKCIKKVSEDMERFSFNTSVSAFMVAVNELTDLQCHKKDILESLVVLVSCHAPFVAEELWEKLGHQESITYAPWPEANEAYLKDDVVSYPISFNGKTRFNLDLPADMGKEQIEQEVLNHEYSSKWLEGKQPKKIIVVPGRIVNVVV